MLFRLVKLPLKVARFAINTLLGPRGGSSSGSSYSPPASSGGAGHAASSGSGSSHSSAAPQSGGSAGSSAAAAIDPRSVQTSPEDIFELQKAGTRVVFVDVREPSETSSGIIDGALLIPSGQLASRFQDLSPDDEIVLYCASGGRSTNGAMFLRGKGYSRAKSLVGGFSHWVRDGGATSRPA